MIRIMLVESDKLLCKEYALEIAQDEEFALVAVTVKRVSPKTSAAATFKLGVTTSTLRN